MEVTQESTLAGNQNQVNITCQVQKFYPRNLNLTWLESGNVSRVDTPRDWTVNKDGTYNWTSWLLVNRSAHRENVVFTCQVEHDGQPAVTKNHTLTFSSHLNKPKEPETTLGEW